MFKLTSGGKLSGIEAPDVSDPLPDAISNRWIKDSIFELKIQ